MEAAGQSHHPAWPDLADHLTESILGRLPLPDLIRSSLVCTKWLHSVQQLRHHLQGSSNLPSIPWLIPSFLDQQNHGDEEEIQTTTVPSHSPFERPNRIYRLRLPNSPPIEEILPSSRGWTLLFHRSASSYTVMLSLVNPVSQHRLQIHPLRCPHGYVVRLAAVSPPPDWALLVSLQCSRNLSLLLLRRGDPHWINLALPPDIFKFTEINFCGAKFYCLCTSYFHHDPYSLFAVDPCTATAEFFKMDLSQFTEDPGTSKEWLVEADGELLLVIDNAVADYESRMHEIGGYHVFKADLARKMWVRMESLGDHRVLLLGGYSNSVMLAAGDVGGRGNCIFEPGGFSHSHDLGVGAGPRNLKSNPWKVFDLNTSSGRMMEWPLTAEADCSLLARCACRWFVPSISSLDAVEVMEHATVGKNQG